MIKTFVDSDKARLFFGQKPRKLPNQIWQGATRKLLILDGAESIQDLRIPPGSRLEK
jgi:proteic killer suppression protein